MRTTRTRKRRIERKQRRQRSSSLRRHLSLSLSYARACLYVYLQNARCVLCCVKSRFFRVFQKSKKNKTCGRSAFSLFPHILKEKPSPALYFLARIRTNDARSEKKRQRERRGDEFGGRERSDIIRRRRICREILHFFFLSSCPNLNNK